MNNTDEVFKNYLRDYQKPVFDDILILIILRTLQKYLGIALPKKKYINYRTRIMAYG